ncbi:hypothetical protein OUY22_27500 [Nonomuraea sp. MCN248]|uniref:WXG100 family type VII secretion target n=1 Tax=Nonomuraea corallina TaxID=2989783 RepID=A0ABT4SIW0_9ACTN|nr:hypothetical protein [Nonomuraea corallina]MDA0637164.1 hypothetical protein [Nonomuraea corallina]
MTEVVQIKSGDRPSGQAPPASTKRAQVKGLLENTNPFLIDGTGQTYRDAATKIKAAVSALEEHAGRILDIWKGPDASKARHALEMLHSSGQYLSEKLTEMGGALATYAGDLQEAQTKVDQAKIPADTADNVYERMQDAHARRTLHELNQAIVKVYDSKIPDELVFDLPKVTLPGSTAETQNVTYPTGSGTQGPTFGNGLTDAGVPIGPGSNPDGSNPDSSNPDGSNPDGSNPDGSNPDGSNPDGSTPGGSNPDGSTPGSGPGMSDPANPDGSSQDPSRNPDGTVPPVIGADETTTTDSSRTTDPRLTDLATTAPTMTTPFTPTTTTPFTPTTTFSPSPFTPTTAVNPPGTLTPMGTPPGSVIGAPGVLGTTPASGIGARGLGGAAGGLPMMPFMGGGGGGAGESGGIERTTFLSEDPNSWTSSHDTTDPVIG